MEKDTTIIYKKILDIQEELPAILKGREFKMNGKVVYKFRGIDDLYNAVNPLFKKHRVFMSAEILNSESSEKISASGNVLLYEKLVIKYRFLAEDGSFVETSAKGIGMDSGDKAANKAMSAAQKYALIQVFSIPTDEPKDSEDDSHKSKVKPELLPETQKWNDAIKHLQKPDSTIDGILKYYNISKDNVQKLQDAAI